MTLLISDFMSRFGRDYLSYSIAIIACLCVNFLLCLVLTILFVFEHLVSFVVSCRRVVIPLPDVSNS